MGEAAFSAVSPHAVSQVSPLHHPLPARMKKPTQTDWWATYFDANYLLEYQPVVSLVRARAEVARRLPAQVFSDRCTTPVVRHVHGDSSGVRGAAWLWPAR